MCWRILDWREQESDYSDHNPYHMSKLSCKAGVYGCTVQLIILEEGELIVRGGGEDRRVCYHAHSRNRDLLHCMNESACVTRLPLHAEHAAYGSPWNREEWMPCVFHLCTAIECLWGGKLGNNVPFQVEAGWRGLVGESERGHKRCSVFSGKKTRDEEGGGGVWVEQWTFKLAQVSHQRKAGKVDCPHSYACLQVSIVPLYWFNLIKF